MSTRELRMRVAGMLLASTLMLAACSKSPPGGGVIELSGSTMGTFYSVQIVAAPTETQTEGLAGEIEAELELINRLMSTYDPASELSRFNQFSGEGWFSVSRQTLEVVAQARSISEITGGAFDVTVGPLVNLWGFGPDPEPTAAPSPEAIAGARTRVGYSFVGLRADPPALRKGRADIYLDLSAIAKGYAVDRLAALLERSGISNYLVDIGGEIRTAGRNGEGEAWRLAVEYPQPGRRRPFRVLRLESAAVATSGNYRNFFELEGVRYAHTIDPRTGWPVSHGLLAVTVVADSTMTADAWATALMVLGPEEGLALAEREKVAALLLSIENGSVREDLTIVMQRLLE